MKTYVLFLLALNKEVQKFLNMKVGTDLKIVIPIAFNIAVIRMGFPIPIKILNEERKMNHTEFKHGNQLRAYIKCTQKVKAVWLEKFIIRETRQYKGELIIKASVIRECMYSIRLIYFPKSRLAYTVLSPSDS